MVKSILVLYEAEGTVTDIPDNFIWTEISLKLMLAPIPRVPAKVISKKLMAPVFGMAIYSVPPTTFESQRRQTPPIEVLPPLLFTDNCKLLFQVIGASWALTLKLCPDNKEINALFGTFPAMVK